MDIRAKLVLPLTLACALALPSSALAAAASLAGPASVAEGVAGGKATYTVDCGDTPNPLSTPLTPLPPVPNTGALAVSVTDGPAPAAGAADRGAPTMLAITCPSSGPVSFDVPIVNDTADEPDEHFTVTVSGDLVAEGAVSQSVSTTITDDDEPPAGGGDGSDGGGQPGGGTDGGGTGPLPTLSLIGVRVGEGDTGFSKAAFALALSSASATPVQVTWRTASRSANTADYESAHGTLVFDPGQTTKTLVVNVKGDIRDEPAEDFDVLLGSPQGAKLATAEALGTIVDDDGPKVAIGRPKLVRGGALRVALGCPASAERCTGTLVATAGRLKLGRARFDLAKGATGKLTLKLSRRARARLHKRALRVKLTAVASDPSGGRRSVVRSSRVRRITDKRT